MESIEARPVSICVQWQKHKLKVLVGKRVFIAVELKSATLHAITLMAEQQYHTNFSS